MDLDTDVPMEDVEEQQQQQEQSLSKQSATKSLTNPQGTGATATSSAQQQRKDLDGSSINQLDVWIENCQSVSHFPKPTSRNYVIWQLKCYNLKKMFNRYKCQ